MIVPSVCYFKIRKFLSFRVFKNELKLGRLEDRGKGESNSNVGEEHPSTVINWNNRRVYGSELSPHFSPHRLHTGNHRSFLHFGERCSILRNLASHSSKPRNAELRAQFQAPRFPRNPILSNSNPSSSL